MSRGVDNILKLSGRRPRMVAVVWVIEGACTAASDEPAIPAVTNTRAGFGDDKALAVVELDFELASPNGKFVPVIPPRTTVPPWVYSSWPVHELQ